MLYVGLAIDSLNSLVEGPHFWAHVGLLQGVLQVHREGLEPPTR